MWLCEMGLVGKLSGAYAVEYANGVPGLASVLNINAGRLGPARPQRHAY
jgi:hypothetical protein